MAAAGMFVRSGEVTLSLLVWRKEGKAKGQGGKDQNEGVRIAYKNRKFYVC